MSRDDMVGFWKTIIETMMDGLMVVDADGMIVAVNRALERVTGYSRDELIGSPCTILNCDVCADRHDQETGFTCNLFHKQHIERLRCNLTRKDGKILPIMKNAAILNGPEGQVTGGVETLTDLTEIVARDRKIARLSSLLKGRDSFHGIIGRSRVMQDVFALITDAAQSDAPIIIYGESGTGKELVAAAIHKLGKRKQGPFVKVNCAALSETLLESELFGHVKGAYTGAERHRQGRFELANQGDIFLDEVGDIPPSMQVKILRVLQEKEFERVGDSMPVTIDVRIVSATHRDLSDMIGRNEFREDLYYRLNVIPIQLPPLRERREDLPLLIEHFLEENRLKTGKNLDGVSSDAMDALLAYHWPGNIRELINTIEYAFVVCRKDCVELVHLPEAFSEMSKAARPAAARRHRDKEAVVEALRKTRGKKAAAAELLGISRQALWKRMKNLGIEPSFGEQGRP